jgi:hypothetical protein
MQVNVFKLVIQPPSSPAFEKSLVDILLSQNLNKAVKLFALDRLFDDISVIVRNTPQSKAMSILDLFRQYSLIMIEAASEKTPWEVPWFRALFQFKKDGVRIDLQPATFLFDSIHTNQAAGGSGKSPLLLGGFVKNMRRLLLDRLSTRTTEEERIFAGLSRFNPYIHFVPITNNLGNQPGSQRSDEIWFNDRIRVHLQRIMILDNLYGTNSASSRCVSTRDQR